MIGLDLLRIVWARRLLIVAAMISAILGGMAVISIRPPTYQASARIILELVKPDPVTGDYLQGDQISAYVMAQMQLIRDYQVAGQAAEDLGWLDSPELQAAYQVRPPDDLDFRQWVAQRIMAGTYVSIVPDSNILNITFRSTSLDVAQAVVGVIRSAYIETSIRTRQEENRRQSTFYAQQAEKAERVLTEKQRTVSEAQRSTGIVLQRAGDLDSITMAALVGARSKNSSAAPSREGTSLNRRLAALDGSIGQASATLGPNNPTIQGLLRQRAVLAAQAQAMGDPNAVISANVAQGSLNRAEAQKRKVLLQGEDVARLKDMQDEVNRAQIRLRLLNDRAATLSQQAINSEIGLTPLGRAFGVPRPVFPNKRLILGGAGVLGAAAGVLAAILLELLGGRRVRSATILQEVAKTLAIGEVPVFHQARIRSGRRNPFRWLRFSRRPATAQ